ncbi:MAG: hypothetical protein HYV03_06760 [Deltaproteobacteria bacterium]|nr:hypothetical protein [Deltaproteobacteria bacterium]
MAERYRLEALRRVKQHVRERAERELAGALRALNAARLKEEELVREKIAIVERWLAVRAEMHAKMSDGGFVSDGRVYVNYLRKLKEEEEAKELEIEAQREVVAQCEVTGARARREYIEATKEWRTMEKHKELWRKKVEAELTRREEREYDELAGTMAQLKRWRGEVGSTEHALGR